MSTPSMQLDLITTKLFFDAFRSPGGVGSGFVAEFTCENLEDKSLFPNPLTISFSTQESRLPVKLILNKQNNSCVATSAVILESCKRDINTYASISLLPEILQDLSKKIKTLEQPLTNLRVMQFPVNLDFRIKDYKLRSHVVNLIIYKNFENNIEILFIDSTINPFGLQDLCFGLLESVQVEMSKLLYNHDFRTALRLLFGLDKKAEIKLLPYLNSGVQSSFPWPLVVPDKRCALYAINLEANIIKFILSSQLANGKPKIINKELSRTVLAELAALAHQEVFMLPEIKVADLGLVIPLSYVDQTAVNNIYRQQRLTSPKDRGYDYIEPVASNASLIRQEITHKKITLEQLLSLESSAVVESDELLSDFDDLHCSDTDVRSKPKTDCKEQSDALQCLLLSLYSKDSLTTKVKIESSSEQLPLLSLLKSRL